MSYFLRTTGSFLLLALAACGDASTGTSAPASAQANDDADPGTDEELPAASFCAGGPNVGYDAVGKAIFDALTPDQPAAYLALRSNVGSVPSPGLSEDLALVAERGELCKGAADAATCEKTYEAIKPGIRLSFHHCYTRGDVAACLQTVDDAVSLLGHVSSLEEAFLIAEYAGYSLSCSTSYVPSRGKALADGSFQLVLGKLRQGGPCGQLHRVVVNVASDGSVEERETKLVDDSPACP